MSENNNTTTNDNDNVAATTDAPTTVHVNVQPQVKLGDSLNNTINNNNSRIPHDLSDNDLSLQANDKPIVQDITSGVPNTNVDPNVVTDPNTDPNVDPNSNVDPNVDPNIITDPNVVTDPNLNTDSNANETTTDDDLKDYTKSALFGKALQEEGLDIFGENFKKDISVTDFIDNFKQFSTAQRNQDHADLVAQVGRNAEYVDFLIKTGGDTSMNPAIQAEKYATFNVDDPAVTDIMLEDVVRAMYSKQVDDVNLVNSLVEQDVSKGTLKEKAVQSVAFHDKFITDTKANATVAYNTQRQEEQVLLRQESHNFAKKLQDTTQLNEVTLTNDVRSKIYDQMYKKDQLLTYTDNNGKKAQEYITKYELLMYNVVNDPAKLIKLNYLLMNDFKFAGLENKVTRKVSSSIMKALEDNVSIGANNITNTNTDNNQNVQNNLSNQQTNIPGQPVRMIPVPSN